MRNEGQEISWPSVLANILRRHTGRGYQLTVAALAERARTTPKVLYMVRCGTYTPSFDMAMRIICALPEEAAAEFLAVAGFTSPRRIDGVPGCFRKLHTAAAMLGHVMARMFEDGRIDHMEAAELRKRHLPVVEAEISRCMGPEQ